VKNGWQQIEKQSRLYWDLTSFFDKSISGVHRSRQLNFFTVTPVIVGPHYGPCFMSPSWRLEFWDLFPEFWGKFVHPWYMGNTQRRDSAKYHNLAELQRNLITVCSGPSLIKFPYSFCLFFFPRLDRVQHTNSCFFRQVEASATMLWLKEGVDEVG
jgi:hypothetical protein